MYVENAYVASHPVSINSTHQILIPIHPFICHVHNSVLYSTEQCEIQK